MDDFGIVLVLVLVLVLVIVLHDRKLGHPIRSFSELERILRQVSTAAIVIAISGKDESCVVAIVS